MRLAFGFAQTRITVLTALFLGSLQRSTRPPSWILGAGEGGGGKGGEKGKEGGGTGPPPIKSWLRARACTCKLN